MIYLKKYNPEDTYISPAGTIMDKTRISEKFPAALKVNYVVQTDEDAETMIGMYSLSSLRSQYSVNKELSAEEQVKAIAVAMSAEQEAQRNTNSEPTAEERIAAALEYQNALNM